MTRKKKKQSSGRERLEQRVLETSIQDQENGARKKEVSEEMKTNSRAKENDALDVSMQEQERPLSLVLHEEMGEPEPEL